MSQSRVIKRYANRKLYDTERSRYVTLDQIAEMIRAGEDVKIVDNNTKEDLTSITLAQIIFEEEKKQSYLSLTAMRGIIQSGGESITQFASQAGEKMRSVFGVKDFLERSQVNFDEWQKKVDERIRHTFEALSPLAAIEKELKTLEQRLADLEKKLDD